MRKRFICLLAVAALVGPLPARAGSDTRPADAEVGIPAQVVDFTPDSISTKQYPVADHTLADDPEVGVRNGTTEWRVVSGTGNAAEVWLTTTKEGRLYDLGGRYLNYSDDRGLTWKSVRPLEPLANAEGSVVVAPNGDILGVTWDPYSGDRVLTYKYSAAEKKWYYNYDPIHTPFWDRPGLQVVPGPFTTPLGTVPYISFINGLPHDPWYYSTDGLNYTYVSSMSADSSITQPITAWADVKADESFDWIQPNQYFPFVALGAGKAVHGSYMFSPEDMRWHDFNMPAGSLSGNVQSDSRGRLHRVTGGGNSFTYSISPDGGRTWNSLVLTGGRGDDFRANAAAGVAAVWAITGRKDLVYKIDITTDTPKLIRRYEVGLGDDTRSGGVGFYGLSGGHRFDFPSISIFPDGRVAVSFMDSTTKMAFPSLGVEVVAPAVAIELETALPVPPGR